MWWVYSGDFGSVHSIALAWRGRFRGGRGVVLLACWHFYRNEIKSTEHLLSRAMMRHGWLKKGIFGGEEARQTGGMIDARACIESSGRSRSRPRANGVVPLSSPQHTNEAQS